MTKLSLLRFSLLILSSCSFITATNAELCNPIDKNALLQLKYHMGPNASAFSTWLPHTDCRVSWFGLGFNNVTNRVSYLTIGKSDDFSGQIPQEIGDLTGLEVLYFNDMPGLTGPIPSTISKLVNLNDLEFFRTNLTGPIPSSIGGLTNLEILDFSENRLSGPIPSSLSLLRKLQGLNLAKNQFTGSIPESFSSFKKLTLQVQENRLSGPMPRSLSQAGFTAVNVSSNKLTGDASFLFGKGKKVILLDLTNNALSFDLSKVEFPLKLRLLYLRHNMIYGSIPKQIAELPKLSLFDVSYNRLCGPIPAGKWVAAFGPSSFEHNHCLCGAPLPVCN